MTVYVIIHTTVDDMETHHREIVPKIMRAVERHGGKRIALGHGEQLRVHLGEPPNANRLVVHEFPEPRGRRGLGRGCQGQSRAAPHPRRPDHHQRAGDLINLGLVKISRRIPGPPGPGLKLQTLGHRFVRDRCEKPLRRADSASRSLARVARPAHPVVHRLSGVCPFAQLNSIHWPAGQCSPD